MVTYSSRRVPIMLNAVSAEGKVNPNKTTKYKNKRWLLGIKKKKIFKHF